MAQLAGLDKEEWPILCEACDGFSASIFLEYCRGDLPCNMRMLKVARCSTRVFCMILDVCSIFRLLGVRKYVTIL